MPSRLPCGLLCLALPACGDMLLETESPSARESTVVDPALVGPSWTDAGSLMAQGRWLHSQTLLRDGDVLLAGGRFCPDATDVNTCLDLSSTETYHPELRSFIAGAALTTARWGHTATALPDGTVLLVGGVPSGQTAEIFTPADHALPGPGTSAATASPGVSRAHHTATLVTVGGATKVLVVGGAPACSGVCSAFADAELYDVATATWAPTQSMHVGRYSHTATLLPSGQVLVVGGVDGTHSLASAEIYDPEAGTWTVTEDMGQARHFHTANLVRVAGTPRVLVAGGDDCQGGSCPVLSSAELYDPAAGTWTSTGGLNTPRESHTASELRNCRILAAAGNGPTTTLSSSEIYDPALETWTTTAELRVDRFEHRATTLVTGEVLVAGGIRPLGLVGSGGLQIGETYDACDANACAFNVAACACPSSCADSDGDGLSDKWETDGIDYDCDGVVDLDLPALGADPARKDIFVELDYMEGGTPFHSHKPDPRAIALVVEAFAAQGIALHVDVSDAIPETDQLAFTVDSGCNGAPAVEFDTLKARYFDHKRLPVFHYGIFAHRCGCDCQANSGRGEFPGNDFMVTLGAGFTESVLQQAGTFMHELGHNLGLHHGGRTSRPRYKPNYISVMNYRFQFGIPPLSRIDYSHEQLPDLDENSLLESAGISDGADGTTYSCTGACSQGFYTPASGDRAIDWNCDCAIQPDAQPVSVDIDGDGNLGVDTGFDDWSNLVLPFQCENNSADGVHPRDALTLEELDLATAQQQCTTGDHWPPTFSVTVSPSVLWPPNHKLVTITPAFTSADNCSAQPTVSLVSVTSSEPAAPGDIVAPDATHIQLAATRSGRGPGRVYTLTFKSSDSNGNSTTSRATVTVPHNR